MHPTLRSARPAAALALALAAALIVPGAAFAGTTEPAPATTTATPTGTTTTASPTTSTTSTAPTASTAPTTTSAAPTTTSPSTTASTPTVTGTPTRAATAAADPTVAQRPFGAARARAAARVAGAPSEQAGYAAGFIVRTLAARGDHYNYPDSTYFDGGNTIDAVLALNGAGVGQTGADAATDYLAAHVGDYVGYSDPANPASPETYAGPLGKLVIGVVSQGGDPTAFGGQDLVARLQGLLTTDGRFSDKSAYGDSTNPSGDYSNTIGQALDIIALGRATGSVPDVAGDYLLAQQCANGGFRGNLDDAGAPCTADTDATAFATQALVGLLGASDPLTVKALDHLASTQAANGGFLNDDGQYNANTAGVAAQAFAAGGYAARLASAQSFLASLQLDCTFAAGLRGGIAFTAADRTTLKAKPNTTAALDRALRATPQSTLGLAGESLLTVTGEGSAAAVPTLSCPTPAPATTKPAAAVADPASATPASLAYTGSNVAALTLLGTLLLLTGVGAIVLARRKGVHA